MRKQFEAGLPGLAVVLVAGCTAVQSLPAGHLSENVEVVHVAPPTGEREADRASIVAALNEVEPGGIVQFAPGTYLIGAGIRIRVARLTLRGHSQGTTLRGCDPDEFATYGLPELSENCDGLRLLAGHQSVHDLTDYGRRILATRCISHRPAPMRTAPVSGSPTAATTTRSWATPSRTTLLTPSSSKVTAIG